MGAVPLLALTASAFAESLPSAPHSWLKLENGKRLAEADTGNGWKEGGAVRGVGSRSKGSRSDGEQV